jgi:oligopeptide transport system substrate-binding protein
MRLRKSGSRIFAMETAEQDGAGSSRGRGLRERHPCPTLLCTTLLAIPFGLAACGNSSHVSANVRAIDVGSTLADEQVINRQLEADPRSLDPALMTDVVGEHVCDDQFEGLVTLDEAGHTAPGVATSWETSADGKTWTFQLRGNARWSNGKPVTADDFVYGWRRAVDPATGSEYSQALAPIENAIDIASGKLPPSKLGVESAGPRALVVHLNGPTPYLPDLLTNPYLMPACGEAVGRRLDAAGAHGFQRALHADRTRPQRAYHSGEESVLLGRRAREADQGGLRHRRRL